MDKERAKLLAHIDKHKSDEDDPDILFSQAWFQRMHELYQDLQCINGIDATITLRTILMSEYPIYDNEIDAVVEWIKM